LCDVRALGGVRARGGVIPRGVTLLGVLADLSALGVARGVDAFGGVLSPSRWDIFALGVAPPALPARGALARSTLGGVLALGGGVVPRADPLFPLARLAGDALGVCFRAGASAASAGTPDESSVLPVLLLTEVQVALHVRLCGGVEAPRCKSLDGKRSCPALLWPMGLAAGATFRLHVGTCSAAKLDVGLLERSCPGFSLERAEVALGVRLCDLALATTQRGRSLPVLLIGLDPLGVRL